MKPNKSEPSYTPPTTEDMHQIVQEVNAEQKAFMDAPVSLDQIFDPGVWDLIIETPWAKEELDKAKQAIEASITERVVAELEQLRLKWVAPSWGHELISRRITELTEGSK